MVLFKNRTIIKPGSKTIITFVKTISIVHVGRPLVPTILLPRPQSFSFLLYQLANGRSGVKKNRCMSSLIRYDIALFTKINGVWHNGFFDWLFPLLRNEFFWSPLYLFLVVLMLLNYGRRGLYWILFFLVTFAIADMLSSSVIKPLVGRLRPCNDPLLADTVRSLVNCGSGKSFTSSHAANHFALAMFAFRTFLFVPLVWRWSFLLWAFAICYAQVYVGVHFPLDVTCGAILGCLIGTATASVFNNRTGLAALA